MTGSKSGAQHWKPTKFIKHFTRSDRALPRPSVRILYAGGLVPRKRKFTIPPTAKLFCPECQQLLPVADVIQQDDFDVAVLEGCPHARSVHVPVAEGHVSVEHLGSVQGIVLWPADRTPSVAFPRTSRPHSTRSGTVKSI